MPYVVTYKDSVVAGPFHIEMDARKARDAKAKEAGLFPHNFKIERC